MLTADVQILSHIWVGLAVPNLAELEVAKQPSQQGEAAMTSFNPGFLRLHFLKLLSVCIALEISYTTSLTFSSHKSKSHSFKFYE
jgi:hypothetical protein